MVGLNKTWLALANFDLYHVAREVNITMTARLAEKSERSGGPSKRPAKRGAPDLAGVSTDAATPLYDQVTDLIRRQIQTGQLARGSRLPTLRQLSKDLGIAYATVARGVQQLVREGVLEARTARGTRVATRRTLRNNTIGILGYTKYEQILTDTRYYRTLLALLQSKIAQRQITVAYNHWQESVPLPSMFNTLQMIDALILMGPPPGAVEQIRQVQQMHMPLVCVGDTITDHSIPTVHSNNENDSYRATRLLQAMGHQRIAAMSISNESDWHKVADRVAGYRRAMTEAGLPCDGPWTSWGSANDVAEQLLALKPAPTALFIISHPADFPKLFDRLQGTPIEPGKGLYLATYDDNLWERARQFKIPFLSVEQDLETMANLVVDHLLRAIDEPDYRIPFTEIPSTVALFSPDGSRQVISQ